MSESRSRKAARKELRRLGLGKIQVARLLNAVSVQGEVMTQTPGGYIRVEYKSGVFTVTR